jgi:enterochelin esterase family protein
MRVQRKVEFIIAGSLLTLGVIVGWVPCTFGAQRDIPHGTLHDEVYYSGTLKMERRLCVYTPPGYEQDAARSYPAVYLLHGWRNDEKAWVTLGCVDRGLDSLLAQGKAKPMIIVMPQGHAEFPSVPPSLDGRPPTSSEALGGDMFNDMIPFVEGRYRIERSAQSRAIAGPSMGGRQALFIGLNHPEMFKWVAGFSAAIRDRVFDDDYQDISENPQRETKTTRLIWLGCGRDDGCFQANWQFHEWLAARGISHVWHPSGGGHEWPVWRDYLLQILPLLFN